MTTRITIQYPIQSAAASEGYRNSISNSLSQDHLVKNKLALTYASDLGVCVGEGMEEPVNLLVKRTLAQKFFKLQLCKHTHLHITVTGTNIFPEKLFSMW